MSDSNGDVIQNRGIIVTSLDEVAVYGLNQMIDSTDGFTALPVDAIGAQYAVMSYPNTVGLLFGGGTNFTIVAAMDNTLVTITPTVTVGSRVAGIPSSIWPQSSAMLHTIPTGTPTPLMADLTGTRIEASQPISVFSGNTAKLFPKTIRPQITSSTIATCVDWGKQFLTQPLATRTGGDTVRVLAHQDDTLVFINDVHISTLAAGQFYETILTTSSSKFELQSRHLLPNSPTALLSMAPWVIRS